jgi:hypothetical protein
MVLKVVRIEEHCECFELELKTKIIKARIVDLRKLLENMGCHKFLSFIVSWWDRPLLGSPIKRTRAFTLPRDFHDQVTLSREILDRTVRAEELSITFLPGHPTLVNAMCNQKIEKEMAEQRSSGSTQSTYSFPSQMVIKQEVGVKQDTDLMSEDEDDDYY